MLELSPKTIYMISGNKGGVGKSLYSLALASVLDMRGEDYAVFDGDGRTGDVFSAFTGKCPARWGDFRSLRPESHNCYLDSEYEKVIHQLLLYSPNLIVNTPDGADAILNKWFDVTLKHTESNNYQFKLIYLMSDRPDGLDMLKELGQRFTFLYPIKNLFFGDETLFSEFNEKYARKFDSVIDFQKLRGHEVRMLFDLKQSPFEFLNAKKTGSNKFRAQALSRARVANWLNLFYEDNIAMMENNDSSNLVAKFAE